MSSMQLRSLSESAADLARTTEPPDWFTQRDRIYESKVADVRLILRNIRGMWRWQKSEFLCVHPASFLFVRIRQWRCLRVPLSPWGPWHFSICGILIQGAQTCEACLGRTLPRLMLNQPQPYEYAYHAHPSHRTIIIFHHIYYYYTYQDLSRISC